MIPAPSAREALNDLSAACMTYFGHYGATHLDECPEDDTCDCPMVTALNAAIGKARKALQAPDELAEAVAAEREACISDIRIWLHADSAIAAIRARAAQPARTVCQEGRKVAIPPYDGPVVSCRCGCSRTFYQD